MKKIFFLLLVVLLTAGLLNGQDESKDESKWQLGFNLALPRGQAPATALTNGFEPIQKSYGFGVLIQRKISKNFALFFDMNTNNYNNLIGEQGKDVQSAWSVAESAIHWDEPDAPHILYVHNLPTDVHFDMQATGFRLGAKYYLMTGKVRPWGGVAYGFYEWQVNYFNEAKDKTYGGDKGYLPGLTYLFGIDFRLVEGVSLSAFADLASPVAYYSIEGLFYPQWDITDYEAHIMGPYRFGVTLSFSPSNKLKK